MIFFEATIGAIGFISSNTRIYNAHLVLISPTCKRENAGDHAKLIESMVKSCEAQLPGSLWSIASDGESQQGAALAKLTLTQKLSHDSPIYPLLSPLPFLNLLVGWHDVTCDKDYKHLFKRLRSLLLHMGGF